MPLLWIRSITPDEGVADGQQGQDATDRRAHASRTPRHVDSNGRRRGTHRRRGGDLGVHQPLLERRLCKRLDREFDGRGTGARVWCGRARLVSRRVRSARRPRRGSSGSVPGGRDSSVAGNGGGTVLTSGTAFGRNTVAPDTSTAHGGPPDGGGAAPAGLRAVVADDETLLREGLASLLDRSGFTVVGQAGNAVELLALVRKESPDVAGSLGVNGRGPFQRRHRTAAMGDRGHSRKTRP